MAIEIREDQEADFEALYRLDQECYEPEVAYSRRMLRGFLHEPGVFCRIAEETAGESAGGKAGTPARTMLGFVIAQQEQRTGHIITLDVPAAQRRKGIGSMLVRDAEERLARAGVREVELEVAVDNTAGVAFWKKHGYCTCGVLVRYYAGKTDALHMIKILKGGKGKGPN